MTVVPDWDHLAFQPWVTFCPLAKSKVSVQLLSAAESLVIRTAPWKPASHCPVTEYSTVQRGAAPWAVTTGQVAPAMRATEPATAKSTERGGCRMSDSLQISAP